MEQSFKTNITDKAEKYLQFLKDWELLISNETDLIAILSNTTAALKEAFNFFWVGFYWVKNEELVLGPFQGNVACYRIRKGRGVCGTAWTKAKTQVIPNVEEFPDHIACSSLSKSEIVIPIFKDKEVIGVLDIDSDQLATFDDIDKLYLEKLSNILSKKII
ncbi:MAG: GAF domain-containing protein [Bacteroidaceae bacterium]|nr:GAF domain-containing protein [Bacteroidaceae bacterium]